MKNKVTAVFLAVVILLTGAFNFQVKAKAEFASMVIISLAALGVTWAATQIVQMMSVDVSDSYETYKSRIANAEIVYDPVLGTWSVPDSAYNQLSADEVECLKQVVSEFNQKDVDPLFDPMNEVSLRSSDYSLGNEIVADNILKTFAERMDSQTMSDSDKALLASMKSGNVSFDMLSGFFGLDIPESYTTLEFLDIDGITMYQPQKITRSDGKAGSKEEGQSWGWGTVTSADGGITWSGTFTNKAGYGIGCYLIYDGTVYYYLPQKGDNYSSNMSCFLVPGNVRADQYTDSNGRTLKAAGFNGDFSGLNWGYFLLTKPYSQTDLSFENLSEDDFKDGTGADYISLTSDKTHNNIATAADLGLLSDDPLLELNSEGDIAKVDGISTDSLNDNIKTIALAQELGLISVDPEITTDDEGNITAVDGIDIKQLKKLVDSMASDEGLSFEDFEEYYQKVIQLLEASNTDTNSMRTILNNIRSKEQAIGKDITQINSAVQSIADALTAEAEITADKTFDVRTPSIITDKFPFSLPFDIYHTFNLLSAEPEAPKFSVPLKMEGYFDFTVDVDLSDYDNIAEIIRWLLYAAFIVGLILATNKLIGRG